MSRLSASGLVGSVVALLAGAGASLGLAASLAPPAPEAPPALLPRPVVQAPRALAPLGRDALLEGILSRNLFDATRPAAGLAPQGEALTRIPATLLATVVTHPAEFSSALIALSGGEAIGYGLGDSLVGRTLVGIERDVVVLVDGDGHRELLTRGEVGTRAPVATPAGAAEGIVPLAEGRWAVDRDLLREYMSDVSKATALGTARPAKGPSGEVDGYRLSRIRRDSVVEQLGLQNGDVVTSINGASLASLTEALALLPTVPDQPSLRLAITRRGQPLTLDYELR
ncbi:MAG: hypothetical protein JXX28_19670 [Deltaproteobacteria bacterium]|nr:hypothetical protein [Deltaproteobacteria bacterium]